MGRAEQRLARLEKICLALPEAAVQKTGRHRACAVRGKKFAYFTDDHHGDGNAALNCKVPPGENRELVGFDPELVRDSYRRAAPKTLASRA